MAVNSCVVFLLLSFSLHWRFAEHRQAKEKRYKYNCIIVVYIIYILLRITFSFFKK